MKRVLVLMNCLEVVLLIYDEVRSFLDEVYERLRNVYLVSSALRGVRLYSARSSVDLECWVLFCSVVDFQVSVTGWLIPLLDGLREEVESRSLRFIDLVFDLEVAGNVLRNFEWSDGKRGFSHRFIRVEDLFLLFNSMGKVLDEYGSLRSLVERLYEKALSHGFDEPLEFVVRKFASELRKYLPRDYVRTGILIPNPSGGSAFKRLNLFFRWMVRPYPDLGVWSFIDKKFLLVSLDSGVLRTVSRVFNLKFRGGVNWKNVLRITKLFRKINSNDPAKYDYVFSRPAIMGYDMKEQAKNRCYLCPLTDICKSARLPVIVREKALMSSRERRILEDFLRISGDRFDNVKTEVPIGRRSIDAIAHERNCNWYVIEVEYELNYTAIGQVIVYRKLFTETRRIRPKALIVCRKASLELKEICELDPGVEVAVLSKLKS